MNACILLIDDDQEWLEGLAKALSATLKTDDVTVLTWVPRQSEMPMNVFDAFLTENDVRLVVTDYDLTKHGQTGFFGATVVDWCQAKAIPVADFSRFNASSLAQEPNLFELRVPVESYELAGAYVATITRGFLKIRQAIDADASLLRQRSPAASLARLLGVPGQTGQFSQYGIRYGGANTALIDWFKATASPDIIPEPEKRKDLLTYIMGHLLVNAILRFDGPLLSRRGLEAYLAIATNAHDQVAKILGPAAYTGPFADLSRGPYYWTSEVDEILLQAQNELSADVEIHSPGEHNRKLAALLLKETLPLDTTCDRCHGENGGFLDPFCDRTVCQRADCSVVSNVWIPAGARLCRFERGFYDEWSPILGM